MNSGYETKGFHAEVAKRFGVSTYTVYAWKKAGLPIRNDAALAKALLQNPRTSNRVKSKALSVQRGFGGEQEVEQAAIANAEVRIRATIEDIVAECERIIAQYKRDEQVARENHDAYAVEIAMKRYVAVSKDLVDIKGKLHRMGAETENTITKLECERVLVALGTSLAKGVASLLKTIKDEEIAYVIEPPAILALMLQPMRDAIGYAAACGLPAWVTDTLVRVAGDVLENGEQLVNAA